MNPKDASVSQRGTVTTLYPMYVVMDAIRRRVKKTHGWFLASIEELDEEQWSWMSAPTQPSIGWHAWHTARTEDSTQANLTTEPSRWLEPGYNDQEILPNEIWAIESIADKWGLDPTMLGRYQAGIEVNCSALLPGKTAILPYVRHVFSVVEQAVEAIDEQRMQMDVQAQPGVTLPDGADTENSVAEQLMFLISHTSRHLGMIEALRGALGLQGSATN